jgi:hypothetical protein
VAKRVRDYKAEYQRRLTRGVARGLSRSQARGHATAAKQQGLPDAQSPLWRAYRTFAGSKNLSAAARLHGVAPERLRTLLRAHKLAERQKGKWVSTDRLPRRVLIYSNRRERVLVVGTFEQAELAGRYWDAAHKFVSTNNIELLAPFAGRSVEDSKGRLHPLETDPNAIHRLAAAGGPQFHEVYRITA